jgi:UDP-N-acetylmuramyl pentapeptide phosphotransferase/UDP-N-acetylglucosamine-1-phosphate transferase
MEVLLWGWLIIIALQLLGIFLFKKYAILDKPGPDVPARNRVPTMQWLVGIIAVAVSIVVIGRGDLFGDSAFLGMRVGLVMIACVMSIDELWRIVHARFRIGPLVRLLVQITSAVVAAWLSYEALLPMTLFGYELDGLLWLVAMIIWFWLFINAINWFDGVYGLSTWVTSIGFWTVVALIGVVVLPAFPLMSLERMWVLSDTMLIASLFGVMTLVWTIIEFKPWWLMRDVGTMSVGFVLAYLSLVWWAKVWTLIVVLALPLMDAVRVIADRLLRRKSNPMKGDFTHLHYRLMAMWRSRTEVRVAIRVASMCFAILMLLQWTNSLNKVIIFIMAVVLFFGINIYLFWVKRIDGEYTWEGKQELGDE